MSAGYERIRFGVEGGVATLVLDNPAKRNAFDPVMRVEMADTPVRLVLIEPGPIGTKIRLNSIPHFEAWIDWQSSPRADQYRQTLLKRLYQPSAKKDRFELPPRAVSEKIAHALESRTPRPRYYVTTPTYIAGIGRRLLPTRALDWFARRS